MSLQPVSSQFEFADVVPHAGDMALLDSIDSWREDFLRARVEIRRDSMFATADGVPAWVGIEYMAQAIAALSGCRSRMNGAAVNIGLLVGSRKYHCTQAYFPVGAILSIEVREVIHAENELSVYGCKLQGEGDFQACFAEANLNVFQPKDPQKFIRGEGA